MSELLNWSQAAATLCSWDQDLERGCISPLDILEDGGLDADQLWTEEDVTELLEQRTPREQSVLRLRVGLDGLGMRTLNSIGDHFEVQ